MADTLSGGRDGGRDGGHGGRRSGKHAGGRNGGRNGKRKSRRNGEARERNEGDGANDEPDELDGEEEITLPGGPIMPPLDDQQIQNGEGYGIPEGGPGNGWSYAGQNEPILGDGDPDNAWSYAGQNEPNPGAQQPGNDNVVQDGQLVGSNELPCYSQVDTWVSNVSREDDPVAHFRFDFDPNGGPPARNA